MSRASTTQKKVETPAVGKKTAVNKIPEIPQIKKQKNADIK